MQFYTVLFLAKMLQNFCTSDTVLVGRSFFFMKRDRFFSAPSLCCTVRKKITKSQKGGIFQVSRSIPLNKKKIESVSFCIFLAVSPAEGEATYTVGTRDVNFNNTPPRAGTIISQTGNVNSCCYSIVLARDREHREHLEPGP